MPFPRPSLEPPMPRMTAWMVSSSAIASLSRLSTMTPAPSPMTNPFARASNGVECVGESAPIALNFAYVAGSMVRSVAPASMTSACRV